MKAPEPFPAFDDCFSDLNQFILGLVEGYEAGSLRSWEDMEEKAEAYFSPERMEQMESRLPGWQKMASYSGGFTLVHVMFVFLALLILPEFRQLTPEEKQMAKWIVLLHDIEKVHIRGKHDPLHAFRSAANAGRALPKFGFPTHAIYPERINSWSAYTSQAFIAGDEDSGPKPDNQKLPEILAGIEEVYGTGTPAALIIKTILFHLSFHENEEYPTAAALTEDEIRRYVDRSLVPLSRLMMLSDNLAWTLFEAEDRDRFRQAALAFFARVEEVIGAEEDQ